MAAVWRAASTRRLSRLFTAVRHPRVSFASSNAIEDDLSKPEPPNGFLFNEKVRSILSVHVSLVVILGLLFQQPLRPGEKRQKEEWENVYVYGMIFNFVLFVVVFGLKPDTRYVTPPSYNVQ